MSEQIERLLVRIDANAATFEDALRKLNRSLHGTQRETRRQLDRIQADMDRAMGGVRRSVLMTSTALGALGVSFGVAELVRDFREAEESSRRLEAVLKTTGHAAGLSAGQIESWARDLEEQTGRSATEIQNAAAQLATFTSVGRKEFTAAIEVANDMAAVFGGDLKSNLDAVARALDDPIEGFANLRKRGFALTDAELKRAEAHIKAGRSAEAQQVVLQNLSAQVNGAAAAVNTGLTKSLNDLRRQAGDTFRSFMDQRGTDAAIAALDLVSKGVVFLGDNMEDLTAAAEVLAVFMATQYVASMGLAAGATLAKAAADMKAKNAAEALSAAMSKHALGIAALGIAALVAGTWALVRAQDQAVIAAKAQARAYAAVQPAQTELERLTRQLVTANDAETASIRRKIAALIEEQAVKAAAARTKYDQTKREESQRVEVQQDVQANPVFSYGGMPAGGLRFGRITGGVERDGTVQESARLRTLKAEAEAMEEVVTAMRDTVAEADTLMQNTTPIEAEGDKNAGKKAEQRRRAIEDMAAEIDMQEAVLRNDQDRIRVLEREAAVRQRTRALIDADILKGAAASAEAERVQKRLDEAMEAQQHRQFSEIQRVHGLELDRIDENHELVRQLERQAELQERIEAYQAAGLALDKATSVARNDLIELDRARADAAARRLTDAEAEHRLTLAQLMGQERLTKQLQDQAEIRERSQRYRADDHGLSQKDAERRATDEVTRERLAATYGEHRQMFARAFSEGIRAAMDGDVKGFLANQLGGLTDTMLQRAGEQIFDAAFGGIDAVAEGAAQGTAMATVVTPAIAGAGVTAAASMGSAITAAGVAAGAAMAAAITAASAASNVGAGLSSIGRMVTGFDQGGYTGSGGRKQPAGIVHKGEVVWSQDDVRRAGGPAAAEAIRRGLRGYDRGGLVSVLPGVNAAVRSMSRANPVRPLQPIIFDLRDAVVTQDLLAQMNQIGAAARAGAVGDVATASSRQQRRARLQTRGR